MYSAFTVRSAVTLVNPISHPLNVYPGRVGFAGAVASFPCSTFSDFNSASSWSTNFTVYLLIAYSALTTRSAVTLVNPISHPLNVYPGRVGSAGAVASFPCSTFSDFNSVLS